MCAVLLGSSYVLRLDPKLEGAGQPYPPLGTLLAAGLLRAQGRAAAVFDATLTRGVDEWTAALEREQPELAVVYDDVFSYLSKMCLARMREAALSMVAAARARGCRVAVGGADASSHPEPYLDAGAAWVMEGDAEETIAELAAGRGQEVAGLVWRDAQRRLRRTPPRARLRELDARPRPAWDLVDLAPYRTLWRRRHGYFSLPLATSRGCPYHCNWCAKPTWGQSYAVRSPADVAEEVAELRARHAPDHLNFVDDVFGLRPGWTSAFADELERRRLALPYRCLSRADLLLRPGEVEALRRSGCTMVWLGAESGSQRVLDAMEKGLLVGQTREAVARLQAAGVAVGLFLQFGYPGETLEDVEATRRLVRECGPDDIGLSVSYPLPGTPFHRRVAAQLGTKQNWTDSDDLDPLYRGPFSRGFYRALCADVRREFRLARWRRAAAPSALGAPRRPRLARAALDAALAPWSRARLALAARLGGRGTLAPVALLTREQAARPAETA